MAFLYKEKKINILHVKKDDLMIFIRGVIIYSSSSYFIITKK